MSAHGNPPPPLTGEGGPRSGSGEGSAASGEVAPLSRPSLTRGPPSRVRGGGRRALTVCALIIGLAVSASGLALWQFSKNLPPLDLGPASLRSTVVLDRSGGLLRPFATADGRWRLPLSAGNVDPRMLAMLTAYEDRRFDSHYGVDPRAVARAAWQWLRHGRIVSGGSTLSMQVARLVEPRPERSLAQKLRQGLRAIELERRLGKRGVLELYLALAPYGGPVEGLRAASFAYFGREPARLSSAEAALLVSLPQSPEARRPDRFPAAAKRARDRVLDIAAASGVLTREEARAAKAEPVPHGKKPFPMIAAHAAEEAVAADPQAGSIRLTLDGRLQASLETLATERAAAAGPGLSAAILVIDNASGAVLTHVGSPGYLDASRRGAIDMTRALRSPGSALKPFIYALAFESGIAHPETLLEDRPVRYAASYAPENFDLTYQGTVSARRALQLSLNVPAVELLEAVGPARLIARLRSAGAGIALPRDAAPGLPVALGGLGITLTDAARLFSGLARGGSVPDLLRRADLPPPVPTLRADIAESVAAWYVADALRGAPPPENALPNRIAYKTGTSYGYRDAWAIGFDRRITVAVWVGRADGAAVPGLVGRVTAAPILFDAFSRYGGEPEPIARPRDALIAGNLALPPPLRHLRKDGLAASGGATPLRIAYPPDGARIDLGLAGTPAEAAHLALKALGGVPPLTWLVDSRPVAESARRQADWAPEGAGFARISVMDAAGASDSVVVRLE
ncbi:MAG: penicillin-binding protein 1C [Methylobacterium sp. CG08_land_8_20_14_0_20_71_15]|uniref:peptidoglycan glycosyltransferase n=5 Tax=Pseudomonadota TaxID=1224 RepID=A0ABQ4T0P9_9HYPH|nr:MAG: penicillin-binding protein 1C [Methylobacterium sp. CG09_land_8_20_14_0_10_71_15]PIU14872.1 MAG: penicillin-binding protein 1C [Methylobacterium sp. CG08_land_8_20_14_0_20_71_15]GBU17968.1 penicillin-binding protein 1C [Methylobacterium sp.]GJE07461.1 Biosynthetic peptidoglycan transglycosylase [Methylobacterium jeotgali]